MKNAAKKLLFCIIGRTCSGKSTVAKMAAKKKGLRIVRSYTTRPPRPSEIKKGLENSDHIFVSDEEFDALKPVAFVQIGDARYCTTMDVLERSDIYIIDPVGLDDLKENAGDRLRIVEVWVHADRVAREKRFLKRGETKERFGEREKAEDRLFTPYEKAAAYDLEIRNDSGADVKALADMLAGFISAVRKEHVSLSNAEHPRGSDAQALGKEKKRGKFTVDTAAGRLIAEETTDPEHPGIAVIFVPEGADEEIDVVLAEVKQGGHDRDDDHVHVYEYSDVYTEEWQRHFTLSREEALKALDI